MAVLALTTVERMLAYLGTSNSGASAQTFSDANKAVLQGIINTVSQEFENYCNRKFLTIQRPFSEILETDAIFVEGVPIVSVDSVQVSVTGRTADLASVGSTSYDIIPGGDGIVFYGFPPGSRVVGTYTGGLAADTAAVIASDPVLVGKAELQIGVLWKRHNSADKSSQTLGNGTTNWTGDYKLLPDVADTLDNQYLRVDGFL